MVDGHDEPLQGQTVFQVMHFSFHLAFALCDRSASHLAKCSLQPLTRSTKQQRHSDVYAKSDELYDARMRS